MKKDNNNNCKYSLKTKFDVNMISKCEYHIE